VHPPRVLDVLSSQGTPTVIGKAEKVRVIVFRFRKTPLMLVNFNVVASLLSEARRHSSIHAKGCVSEGYTPPLPPSWIRT
jgi:hypothetical protein